MEQPLKQRLVGAVVLVALAVIFVPMLLNGPVQRGQVSVPVEIPPKPEVKPSSQLPQPDSETARQPPPERVTQSPEPVDSETAEPPAPDASQAAAQDESSGAQPSQSAASDESAPVEESGGTEAEADNKAAGKAEEEPQDQSAGAENPPEAAKQGNWAVQVGGFRNRDNALSLRDKLRGKGYDVYVDDTDWKGKPLYRVRLGPVMSEDDAKTLLGRVQKQEDIKGIVVSR